MPRFLPTRGFTLVETVITIFILGLSLVVLATTATSFKNTKDQLYENVALRVASTKLYELRAGGYAALPASGSFTDTLLSSIPSGTASTTITTYNSKVKQVVVGVSWLSTASITRYVSVTTLITNVGGL